MREIKFRAWVKEVFEDGEFAYGGYMIEPHQIKSVTVGEHTNLMLGKRKVGIEYFEQGGLLPGMGSLERCGLDEIELMQYTGLKDKNGTDIYEGDVLKTDLSRPYLIVGFRNGAFMYQCHDSDKDYYDYMLPVDAEVTEQDKSLEVIGNIYANEDLLV